jgi:site-specific recombinase
MHPTATGDRTATFASLLQDLLDDPSCTSGEWLARLVAEIRPRGRENPAAARARLWSLIGVLRTRPEFGAALNAHLGALLTSRMHRILYAESGILTNPGFMSGLVRRLLGRPLPPAVDTEYLRDLVVEVFDHPEDHLWMFAVPREDWAGFAPARRSAPTPHCCNTCRRWRATNRRSLPRWRRCVASSSSTPSPRRRRQPRLPAGADRAGSRAAARTARAARAAGARRGR